MARQLIERITPEMDAEVLGGQLAQLRRTRAEIQTRLRQLREIEGEILHRFGARTRQLGPDVQFDVESGEFYREMGT